MFPFLLKIIRRFYFYFQPKESELYFNKFTTELGIGLSLSAWAIKTKYRLGGLKNRHLFLTILESGKSKIKVTADLVRGSKLLPAS